MGRLLRIIRFSPLGPIAVLYEYGTQTEVYQGTIEDAKSYAADIGDEIVETITEGAGAVAGISLDFIRNLGGALIDGIDGGYDAIKARLDLEPDDVVAGFTIAALSILAGVYLYHSVKAAQDAV